MQWSYGLGFAAPRDANLVILSPSGSCGCWLDHRARLCSPSLSRLRSSNIEYRRRRHGHGSTTDGIPLRTASVTKDPLITWPVNWCAQRLDESGINPVCAMPPAFTYSAVFWCQPLSRATRAAWCDSALLVLELPSQ